MCMYFEATEGDGGIQIVERLGIQTEDEDRSKTGGPRVRTDRYTEIP